MSPKQVAAALLSGLAAFLVVAVAASELAASRVAFSVFVGIPAGLVAGVLVAVGVSLGVAADASPERRRVAVAVVGSACAFLAASAFVASVFDGGVLLAMGVGALAGVVTAAVAYARGARTASPASR